MIIENMNMLVPYLYLKVQEVPQIKNRIFFHTRMIKHNYKEILNLINVVACIIN